MIQEFKLGPLQTLWLKQLRAHPDRQIKDVLGEGTPKNYKACCLGELHLCAARLAKKKLPFIKNTIEDGDTKGYLTNSFAKYGLRSKEGESLRQFETPEGKQFNLASANDDGVSWTEIADIIEEDPTNFFTKSV